MLLRFDPTYKHVLNVDYSLKERINLIYLISKRLEEYKISFYGNQADNFKSYWKPY
jgi:hypothetical protein